MIDYIECENYIRIICEGIFSIADLPAQCESLLAHRSWKQNIGLFFDFRNFDFGKMDIGVSRMILSQYEQLADLFGYGKVALLMNSTLGFGLGRQFQIIAEDTGHREIEVFSDEAKALEWLMIASEIQ